MKASRFSDAQKAFILKQGSDGMPVADICCRGRDQPGDLSVRVSMAGVLMLVQCAAAFAQSNSATMSIEYKKFYLSVIGLIGAAIAFFGVSISTVALSNGSEQSFSRTR
jgi:hypothetical protein